MEEKEGKSWKIKFRGDEIVLRDVGMKILGWVDKFKDIGDIVVQFDPVHAALPWAGFRFLLKLCLDKQETVDEILIGLEKTACIIDRCKIYELLYLNGVSPSSANLEKSMLRLYTAVLKFLAQAIKRSKGKCSRRTRLGGVRAASNATGRCQHDNVTPWTSSRQHTANTRRYQSPSKTSPNSDWSTHTVVGSKRTQILKWISTIAYTDHHARISEGRLKGTGDWLFKKEEYRAWRSSSASKLLLLHGIPGAGKTYIASTVVDSFLSNPAGEKLAYFYCNRAEEDRRNPESILNTLIQQLCQAESEKDRLLKPVIDIYQERESKGQTSSLLRLAESQELLVQLTDIYPQTTICIDALDEVESGTRMDLLQSLMHVIERSKNLVKIFATTRMDTDILLQFNMFPRIELQSDDNVNDIKQFVETKVQSSIAERKLLHGVVSSELKVEICDVLCKRSTGMFQLAALQITFLCEMATPNDVRRGLNTLPDTLTAAYDEIYTRLRDQKGSAPRLALRAFRWIQCSYEPLSSETLLDAITVEIGDAGDKDTITVDGLLKVCQNLLILDKRLNVFRFAHLSVDEYLETKLPK
ncbi:hypothetical protein FN846DRAFT_786170, partial [Sphaerosporella brunnea]